MGLLVVSNNTRAETKYPIIIDICSIAGLQDGWCSCSKDDDCTLRQRDCGMSYALNKVHADEAIAAFEKFCGQPQLKPIAGCPIDACIASPRPADMAVCEHDRCRPAYR